MKIARLPDYENCRLADDYENCLIARLGESPDYLAMTIARLG